MRSLIFPILLIGAVLISKDACAADLSLRVKPAVQRAAPLSPEERWRLFEEFREFSRERGLHSR
jgi:hypothetical protein